MKLLFVCFLVFLLPTVDSISIKFRRWCSPWKFCSFTNWKEWGPCDKTCGGGVRSRYRQMCSLPVIDFTQHVATCHKKFTDFIQYENCSQTCSSYGTWSNLTNQCDCNEEGITDSCCTTDRGRWSNWFDWSQCSGRCGNYGVRNRTRICLWKSDLTQRDVSNTNCIGDSVQYESCLKLCEESDYDNEYFDKIPLNQTTSIGKHVQFICKPKFGTIKWFIDDQDVSLLISKNPSIKLISTSSTLFIFPVTNFFSAETRISCRIDLPNGEYLQRHAWLQLDSTNDDDRNSSRKQCGLLKNFESIYYVRFGSSFSIDCQSKTRNATIIWEKNSVELPNDDDEQIEILSETILFIKSVDFRHNTTFSCRVETNSQCKQSSSWNLFVFERNSQITESFQTNIVNFVGTHGFALSGSAPWHVTVSYRDFSSNFNYETFCSGLIIDEETIVSVSQCFDETSSLRIFLRQENLEFDVKNLFVSVGKYDRRNSSEFERQSSVINLIDSSKTLVILKVRLVFLSVEARPLILAKMNDFGSSFENFELFGLGWGPLSSNGEKSVRLKYVRQQFVRCNDSSSPTKICTTSVGKNQVNLCPGDVGAVLFAQNKVRTFAVGLISKFSRIFCDSRSKQITTIVRLDTMENWIRQNSLF